MKNQLILTAGGKGGVGKTIAMTTLADYLTKTGIPYSSVDADMENDGKPGAFGNYMDAERINLRSEKDCDRLLTMASQQAVTLCDLPANASGDIMPWFNNVITPDVLELLNLEITCLGCIAPELGSFGSIFEWAEKLKDRVNFVLVLNRRTQQKTPETLEKTFPEVFATKSGTGLLKSLKPALVDIEGLYAEALTCWGGSEQLPSAFAKDMEYPVLLRIRVEKWIGKIHPQWERAIVSKWV